MQNKQDDIEKWMDIFLRKGYVSPLTFGDEENNPQNTMEFMRRYGMDKIYNQYLTAERDVLHTLSDEQRDRATVQMTDCANIIRHAANKMLYEQGIMLDQVFRSDDKEAAKESVREQLRMAGFSDAAIDALQLDDLDNMQYNDKTFTFTVDDTDQTRGFFDLHGFSYRKEGDKLVGEATVHLEEGIKVDDTEENRKMLDENEIEYIRMAEGKNPKNAKNSLFIPFSWDAYAYAVSNQGVRCANRIVNSQVGKNAALLFGMIAATALFHPAVAWCVFIAARRSGIMRDKGNRGPELNLYKQRALEAGHTIMTTQKRHGRLEEVYMYRLGGRNCVIPARDVRIPDRINGVRLSAAQRESFRRGELVELTDKNGQGFHVRIDVTNPDMVRHHYKVMRTDKQPTAVPNRLSPDTEKLDYIARFGYKGVNDIYRKGGNNRERDNFLQKYGLHEVFSKIQNADFNVRNSFDKDVKQQNQEVINKSDAALKDLANNLVLSQHKQNGRGI